ncbi:UNVERIFIED_CONTAM: Rho GTPase-activating protein 7, partial [Sesamum radiatum]
IQERTSTHIFKSMFFGSYLHRQFLHLVARHCWKPTVARLQEQLQAERDLRAALEVGLSMSSGHFSGSRGMDSKTRAELEEIALAEADVARLKQKVAELHHQLNQQRQHHYGSLSDACDRYQHAANQSSQQCQVHTSTLCGSACRVFGTSFLGIEWGFRVRKYFQQDFDTTLAVCNHERKQRTEELLGADLRNIKGQLLTSGSSSRLPSRKLFIEPTNSSDSKSAEASTVYPWMIFVLSTLHLYLLLLGQLR